MGNQSKPRLAAPSRVGGRAVTNSRLQKREERVQDLNEAEAFRVGHHSDDRLRSVRIVCLRNFGQLDNGRRFLGLGSLLNVCVQFAPSTVVLPPARV